MPEILVFVVARDPQEQVSHVSRKADIERLAGRCLEFALGPMFEFRHTGDESDKVDGYLLKEGHAVIAVEVTEAASKVLREFNAAIENDPSGLVVSLRPGSGKWFALLDPSTRLRDQGPQEWQEVTDLLLQDDITSYARNWYPGAPRLNEMTDRLGIESMKRFDIDGGEIHRVSAPLGGFFISTSLDALAEETAQMLNESRMVDKIERLVGRAGGLEAHLVGVSAEGLSVGTRFALASVGPWDFPPAVQLKLPPGLACVWLIQPEGLALAFSATQGWFQYDLRDMHG